MKYVKGSLALFIICFLCTFALWASASPVPAIEVAPEEEPQARFFWGSAELAVTTIQVDPSHIGNPRPDMQVYLLIHFDVMDGGAIHVSDLIASLEQFYLMDPEGNTFYPGAYMPYAITYNERNSVFVTAPEQPSFDLFFGIPRATPMEDFSLEIEVATPDPVSFSLCDEDIMMIIEEPRAE